MAFPGMNHGAAFQVTVGYSFSYLLGRRGLRVPTGTANVLPETGGQSAGWTGEPEGSPS